MDITRQEYGGKGYALHQLRQAGFAVPEFIVLPVSFLRKIGPDSRAIVEAGRQALPEWAALFGDAPVAVRSSAVAEDSAAHSFAGQFKTLLNVPLQGLPEAVAEVWASASQAQAYASAHGLKAETEMAVILQRMVPATAAGVAFSANPVTGTGETIVNAVAGLGDTLVDGSANADRYAVLNGAVILSEPIAQIPVLTDAHVLAVAAQAAKAHRQFGGPQDMEFAFEGEVLYILQSRPITTLPKTPTVWDNSNIVESYPGLTGPLTFTFIRKMYEAVYRQFSSILGVGQGKMEQNADAFASMLGLLNGRVYYNLNSWYQALALLPGYSLNAAFMEKMMGVKEKPAITLPEDRTPGWKAWWQVASAVAGIVRNLAGARRQARNFEKAFNKVYSRFDGQDFDSISLSHLWKSYQQFETLMVREWKAPLVNDFFAMIYFGLLQKLCAGLAPGEANLHNRLLAGSDAVLTTQPMRELPRIVEAIAQKPDLLRIALEESDEALYAALQRPEHAETWAIFFGYIQAWGERSVAELKLETVTYRQEPLRLVRLLQSYVKGNLQAPGSGTHAEADRLAAEALVQRQLKGKPMRRALFAHVLKQARYFVTQRENLRYYRTRGFGMVRRLLLAMGRRLAEAGSIETARDVFWLELSEVQALAEGPKPMQEVAARRKALYQTYEGAPLPERITGYGVPKGVICLKPGTASPSSSASGLHGIPCSAGVVRAKVRLVRYSDDLTSLDGAILATYATDPGFVVLFASASGILTERGSLLSHAAIVSREMGIPCIVGIEGLMDRLTDGALVEMDGGTGTVTLLDNLKPA